MAAWALGTTTAACHTAAAGSGVGGSCASPDDLLKCVICGTETYHIKYPAATIGTTGASACSRSAGQRRRRSTLCWRLLRQSSPHSCRRSRRSHSRRDRRHAWPDLSPLAVSRPTTARNGAKRRRSAAPVPPDRPQRCRQRTWRVWLRSCRFYALACVVCNVASFSSFLSLALRFAAPA